LPEFRQGCAKRSGKANERVERLRPTGNQTPQTASPEVIQQVTEGKKTVHAALAERKQKPTGKYSTPPRRKTVAQSQEPEEQVEYLKIPLPLDHMTMATTFGRRFQSESDEVKEQILHEIDLFYEMIQNLRCD
jgi:hypothetical protein